MILLILLVDLINNSVYSYNNLGILKGMDILEFDMSGYTSQSKMLYALNKFLLLYIIQNTFKEHKKNVNE